MNQVPRGLVFKLMLNPRRTFASTIDEYIVWHRPRKVKSLEPEKTGDVGGDLKVDPNNFVRFYEMSDELKNADELVKKVFSLQFHNKKQESLFKQNRMMELVKRHEYDHGSIEAVIAKLTSKVRHHYEVTKGTHYNWQLNQYQRELVARRNKLLRLLRQWDYRRFEWILEKLDLVYKPVPAVTKKPSRRESLTYLTDTYCDNIIQSKLNQYKMELQKQQKDFYREKAEKLEFIRKEEEECGLPFTVTLEEIEEAKKKAEELAGSN